MGAKNRTKQVPAVAALGAGDEVPAVGGREPCPCGSGRRYKACHGRAAARPTARVHRPFAGLRSEADWVCLREVVPAATAPLPLTGEHAGREVMLATVLPMAWPALVRNDGRVMLGLQVNSTTEDPSRDAASALLQALDAEPGSPVTGGSGDGEGPRLQDLLDPEAPLQITVHEGFDFWIEGVEDTNPEVAASMERANAAVVPTARLVSVEGAYWARLRDRISLRWALPHDEEPLLDAMARLHVAGADRLGDGSRFIGSFRAHGLLVPVWDLADGTLADDVEDPAAAYHERLSEALAEPRPLTEDERRARSGLLSRQITLR
jgi:hypothetical protein